MRDPSPVEREMVDLTWALVSGKLDTAGAARLEQMVIGDALCRRTYLAAIDLVAGLEWGQVSRPAEERSAESGWESIAETFGVEVSSRPMVPARPRLRWFTKSPARSILVVACVYYAVAALLFGSLSIGTALHQEGAAVVVREDRRPIQPVPEGRNNAPVQPQFVARLIGGRGLRWHLPGDAYQAGDMLDAGVMRLRAGVAEIEFGNGARVALRGPASIHILSSSSLRLNSGTLTALVPSRGIGFSVDTPTSRIVDLGTEFSVAVDKRGATHVRVLQGQVELASIAASETGATPKVLSAGESEWIGRGEVHGYATTGSKSGSISDQFVRRVKRPFGPTLIEQGGSFAPNNLSLLPDAVPFASPCLAVQPHTIQGLADGRYGNSSSWIAERDDVMFAGVRFGGRYRVSSIAFGRDNGSDYTQEQPWRFQDRSAGIYTLQYTTVEVPDERTPHVEWHTIGTISQGAEEMEIASGKYKPSLRHRYVFEPVAATAVRLLVSEPGIGIDELEVYATE